MTTTKIRTQFATLFVAIIFVAIFSFFSGKMDSHVKDERAQIGGPQMTVVECLKFVENTNNRS